MFELPDIIYGRLLAFDGDCQWQYSYEHSTIHYKGVFPESLRLYDDGSTDQNYRQFFPSSLHDGDEVKIVIPDYIQSYDLGYFEISLQGVLTVEFYVDDWECDDIDQYDLEDTEWQVGDDDFSPHFYWLSTDEIAPIKYQFSQQGIKSAWQKSAQDNGVKEDDIDHDFVLIDILSSRQ